jgi:predicted esterase YcpF (UPF0227 family)
VILYLHGFSSGGTSTKATQLRDLLAPLEVRAPTYPAHDARRALARLEPMLLEMFPRGGAKIVGSSLGGYYAQYLASRDPRARAVLINPALHPQRQLAGAVGMNTNMVTGERFEFTTAQHAALARYDVAAERLSGRVLVLLDERDEVIDPRHAAEKYRLHGTVRLFPGGSHRFEHLTESLPLMREFLGI